MRTNAKIKYATVLFVVCTSLVIATASTTATAQLAQSSSYTSSDVTAGTSVQLGFYAFAHDNCTPARSPTIRIIKPPRAGMLTVKLGELTTDKIVGCSSYTTPAQIVFYRAGYGDDNIDYLIYEVTSPNGDVEVFQFTIHIRVTGR